MQLDNLKSWPLFALSHHLVVWYSAERVWPGRVFRDYAILGDDVVIACALVAKEYIECCRKLQIGISKDKTIRSSTGALEFAKCFMATVDLSPISLRALLGSC